MSLELCPWSCIPGDEVVRRGSVPGAEVVELAGNPCWIKLLGMCVLPHMTV